MLATGGRATIFPVLSSRNRRLRRVVGAVALLLAIEVALLAFGLGQVWAVFLGVPLTIVVGLAVAAVAPRVQQLTRPQPRLSLLVDGETAADRLVSNDLAPWPSAVERVVANEAAESRATTRLDGLVAFQFLEALTQRPSEASRKRAKERFEATVLAYENQLRDWLLTYEQLAAERHACREIRFGVVNRGAHAEAVRLVLELPATVHRVDVVPSMTAPPRRPVYTSKPEATGPSVLLNLERESSIVLSRPAGWELDPAGHLAIDVGDVHRDHDAYTPDAIVLRASEPGGHVVGWKLLTKSASKAATGSFVFHVPEGDPSRPAFGRLAGILEYPDLVIRGVSMGPGTDPVDLKPRTTDPPVAPPEVPERGPEGNVTDRIIRRREALKWRELGLDPQYDGPTPFEIADLAGELGSPSAPGDEGEGPAGR